MKVTQKYIYIKGARENNLQNIDIKIPRDKFVVITGLSGSGKSSLAFNTIYAEGQRRYVESLSSYARQFIGIMEKPDLDYIEGLSPSISIDQKSTSRNPRSTVGTVTEIYDYLRLLFSRIGKQHCIICKNIISKNSAEDVSNFVTSLPQGSKITILSPIFKNEIIKNKNFIRTYLKEGFIRCRINGQVKDLSSVKRISKTKKYNFEIVVDRLINQDNIIERLNQSIELAYKLGNGILILNTDSKDIFFSENLYCVEHDITYDILQPSNFSFNSPLGACSSCDGLGTSISLDPDLIVTNYNKSLKQGCLEPLGPQPSDNWYGNILKQLSDKIGFSFSTPWKNLSSDIQNTILYGSKTKSLNIKVDSKKGFWKHEYEGLIPNLNRRYHGTGSSYIKDWIEKYMTIQPCKNCEGARLNEKSLNTLINNFNIYELTQKPIHNLFKFLKDIKLNISERQVASEILKEIKDRLEFLINVGLDYLTLSRPSRTLSGGEMQRIRLATQIGSQLVGVLYVLDEPSIGLHPRDNAKLIQTLQKLKTLGNTVLVVEHDEQMMKLCDWIIDLGPGAGINGGKIVAQGTPKQIQNHSGSVTGKYLSGKKTIQTPNVRRVGNNKFLKLKKARGNNLKNISISIPLGCFVSITGVSGSGKSTLINQTLFPIIAQKFYSSRLKPLKYGEINGVAFLDKVVNITQSPIGKTPRSNPATYTGVFGHIRDLYSQLPDAKIMGYKPGRFSFNVKGGRCEHCQGGGLIKIEMHFLSDVYITCERCKGKRFNNQTLQIKYKSKNIYDILDMTIDEAFNFFQNHKSIARKLNTLCKVGLGYIKLGQQATSLSGGESQRIKLASELSKVNTGKTLYILDEPTTGLHFQDIEMLITVLNSLVDKGNTVIVIEHNLDVIKSSDWIIDLGPEGGDKGGYIVEQNTPEKIIKSKNSYTGKFLKNIL